MRVVLDTNVVVSALIWGGTPFRLNQAATAGDIELYTSPVLLAELREVLALASGRQARQAALFGGRGHRALWRAGHPRVTPDDTPRIPIVTPAQAVGLIQPA